MKFDAYSFEVESRVDGDDRRYPGQGNRHERRKAAAEARRSGAKPPTVRERFTFRFAQGEFLAGDVYAPPAIKIEV